MIAEVIPKADREVIPMAVGRVRLRRPLPSFPILAKMLRGQNRGRRGDTRRPRLIHARG